MLVSDGMVPSDGNAGLSRNSAVEELIARRDHVRLELRLPADAVLNVRLVVGCHLSWTNSAGSVCGMSCVPASSTVSPPTPACCRNRSSGPVMLAPAGHGPLRLVVPLEHSTYVGPKLRVVEESVSAAEDVAPVGEPDECLRRIDAVEFEATLDRVPALDPRQVVDELHARVVIVDRDEERLPKR